MAAISIMVDRNVNGTERYQLYENAGSGTETEITFDFEKDIGKKVRGGYIQNNNAVVLSLYFNYAQDPFGTMQPIKLAATDRFVFDPSDLMISTLKITGAGGISVDLFVS